MGDQWRLQFGTSEAATEWPQLCTQFPVNCREAYERMRLHPLERAATEKPLSGALATRFVDGEQLPQWQIDISSGARLWYCVDEARRRVWLMAASAGHPGATVAKGKRSSRNR